MKRHAAALAVALLITAQPAFADGLELAGTVEQGGLIRGLAAPGAKVTLDERDIPVAPDGRFLIGFGRDAPTEAVLRVLLPDGSSEERRLAVAKRSYDIQRVDGLAQEMVTPDPEALARIRREADMVAALRAAPGGDLGFEQRLAWPAKGPISGVYGSQRILNGEPRAPHMGVDVAAPAGTPVRAAAAGTVRLAEPLYLTGNTILIDHGFGLTTSYAHLSRLDVAVGQHVEQGEEIGLVGATGRVTAAHLHWGLEWLGVRLDPQRAVGPMPGS